MIVRERYRRWGFLPAMARRLSRDARGIGALEFALILPVALLFLVGIVQFGSLFFLQNNMLNVARELSRQLAVGAIEVDSAQNWAVQRLPAWVTSYQVAVDLPISSSAGEDLFDVTISAPTSEAVILDPIGLFAGSTLQASASMRDSRP